MNRSIWHRLLLPGVAVAVLGVASAWLVAWFRTPRFSHPSSHPPRLAGLAKSPPGSYPELPLAAGAPSPSLEAAGWVNGAPPPLGDGPRLIVLDIWAHW